MGSATKNKSLLETRNRKKLSPLKGKHSPRDLIKETADSIELEHPLDMLNRTSNEFSVGTHSNQMA